MQPQSATKTHNETDTAGIFILYALGALLFIIFSISCVFAFFFIIIAKASRRDKWLYYASPIALVSILILFQAGKVSSTLGTLKYAPVIKQYFQGLPNVDVWAAVVGACFGVLIAAGFRIWETMFNKKVISKKDEMTEKRNSRFYEKVQKNKVAYIKKAEQSYKGQDVFLGITEFNEPFAVTAKELNQHTLCVGTTGSGKTVFILSLTKQSALKRDIPVIAIDGKGDTDFIREFEQLAKQEGKKLYVFSDVSDITYNPIKQGTATMVRDKIMALFEWSEVYYKNNCSRFLQLLIQIFDKYNIPRDLQHIYKYTDLVKLNNLLEQQHKVVIEEVPVEGISQEKPKEDEDSRVLAAFGMAQETQETKEEAKSEGIQYKEVKTKVMDSVAQDYQERLATFPEDVFQGLQSQVGELIESDLGHLFEETGKGIDLRKIVEEKAMVLFSIDGLAYRDYVKKLARLVIMDINNLCSHLYKTGRQPVFAIFDEFSCYVNDEVVDIINKARGAGLEAIIGTQGLGDIDKVSPALRRQIVNNCNVHVAMRVNDGEEAETLAKTIGTYDDNELTIQTKERSESEMGTSRQVERFKAHPNAIKELATGEAFIARRAMRGEVHKVYIKSPFASPSQAQKRRSGFLGNISSKTNGKKSGIERAEASEK
ncbi:type IV secretory system conjugative DNA transfer family protein [Ectobacillus panaciterrae]|uniref:type IV secretory system conjugative DNA transfer family protein n=1 Tax=Ectobacillus panaciterrae TaxID=363872 RepID=UPI0003F88588|nr:TraM recognition domain-containing protein [Ectobacillus panaciterrae]